MITCTEYTITKQVVHQLLKTVTQKQYEECAKCEKAACEVHRGGMGVQYVSINNVSININELQKFKS